ncbi:MAG: SoxR reducing system RseC family protein [Desulfuromonadaceae bacterium]|nr:SoxR reducing system RseC family protein [Desulfuromonadaceae bacterium]
MNNLNRNKEIKKLWRQFLHPQRITSTTGTVVALKPKRLALVECADQNACSGCSGAGNCCQKGPGAGAKRIMADNIPYAREGDLVKVEIETSAGILDSDTVLYIIAFVMLALGLALGYGIAASIAVGIPAAILAILVGAAFMTGTIGVLRFGRQAVIQTALARIVEIKEITPKDRA